MNKRKEAVYCGGCLKSTKYARLVTWNNYHKIRNHCCVKCLKKYKGFYTVRNK